MNGERLRIAAIDGHSLGATRYTPAMPRLRLVIASATGVPRAYYTRFAAALAEADIEVTTFDYRGIGDSRPAPRGACMKEWGTLDLEGVLRSLDHRLPLAVVGHSVGTQIFGLAPSAQRVARVLSIAGQSGDFRNWTGLGRVVMATLWYAAIPAVATVLGRVPGWMGIGAELPAGVAKQWAAWGRTPGYLLADADNRAAYAKVRADMRALAITDDPCAPEAAVRALMAGYVGARCETERLHPAAAGRPEFGHFGYFKKDAASLWPEAITYLHGA